MVTPKVMAIRDAIKSEEEAYDLYKSLKEMAKEENTIKLCVELMRAELRHKTMLEDLGIQDLQFIRERIARVGGKNLDIAYTLEKPLKSMEIEELFDIALKKEAESVKRYSKLVDLCPPGELKEFFQQMLNEERGHVDQVGIELEKYKRRIRTGF